VGRSGRLCLRSATKARLEGRAGAHQIDNPEELATTSYMLAVYKVNEGLVAGAELPLHDQTFVI